MGTFHRCPYFHQSCTPAANTNGSFHYLGGCSVAVLSDFDCRWTNNPQERFLRTSRCLGKIASLSLYLKEGSLTSDIQCWINQTHESERLYLHYVWIFMAQLGSVAIYTTVFFVLRKRLAGVVMQQNSASHSSSNEAGFSKSGVATTTAVVTAVTDQFAASRQRIARTARYMVVYPFAYVALTLPLAAGRVSAMTGKSPPLVYFPVAGTLMASCGVIDVILYMTTRKALVRGSVGMKSSGASGSVLRKFRTADSRRTEIRSSIRMEGLKPNDTEEGTSGRRSHLPKGTIVVSKSVTRSEDSFGTTPVSKIGVTRSESMRSLVKAEEGNDKSWLA
jgi:hypothetical protein